MDLRGLFLLLGDLALAQFEGTVLDSNNDPIHLASNQALFEQSTLIQTIPGVNSPEQLIQFFQELKERGFLSYQQEAQDIVYEINLEQRAFLFFQMLAELLAELDCSVEIIKKQADSEFGVLSSPQGQVAIELNLKQSLPNIRFLGKYTFHEKEIALPRFLSLFFQDSDGIHNQNVLLHWIRLMIEDQHFLKKDTQEHKFKVSRDDILEMVSVRLEDETGLDSRRNNSVEDILKDGVCIPVPGLSQVLCHLDQIGQGGLQIQTILPETITKTLHKSEVRNIDLPADLDQFLSEDLRPQPLDLLCAFLRIHLLDLQWSFKRADSYDFS